jgi:hypothetical protein
MKLANFKGLKALVKAHEAEIVASGATVGVAGAAAMSQVPVAFMDTNTDAINSSISMLTSMLNSFATVIPALINFVIALFPLIIIGIILGLIVWIFRDWIREILGVMFR